MMASFPTLKSKFYTTIASWLPHWRFIGAIVSAAGCIASFISGLGLAGFNSALAYPVPVQGQRPENAQGQRPENAEKQSLTLPPPSEVTPRDTSPSTVFLAVPESTTAAVNRLLLAQQLVQWFNLPLWPVSDFPLFVDIARDHPQYALIDTVHNHHLLFADERHPEAGFFMPEATATRLDLWLAVGKMLAPKNLMSDEEMARLLQPFEGVESIPRYYKKRLAQLVLDGVLSPTLDNPLQADASLTVADLQRMASTLKVSQQLLQQRDREAALSVEPEGLLPPKLTLLFTPSQAITSDRLTPGSEVLFQLLEPLTFTERRLIKVAQPNANATEAPNFFTTPQEEALLPTVPNSTVQSSASSELRVAAGAAKPLASVPTLSALTAPAASLNKPSAPPNKAEWETVETTLPEGSSLSAVVESQNLEKHTYQLHFKQLRSARDGRKYQLNAMLNLLWKEPLKGTRKLLLTGDKLSVETQ